MDKKNGSGFAESNARYWDQLAGDYQRATTISVKDFHYGPLLPGDADLGLLPKPLQGKRCLELGCGAAQNSIYLAKNGADAVAMDISQCQLDHARKLTEGHGVSVDLRLGDMEALDDSWGTYDLIHSAYGVPFAADPAALIQKCADRLRPGGTLLISMGHPVYAGEWLELDENEQGIFLNSYFHPTPDVREAPEKEDTAVSVRAYPVAETVMWVLRAGLTLTALHEPKALPVHDMSREERRKRVPYYSADWAEQVFELQKFPIVLILKAEKHG
ncbi:MAG: class I SAM-dependent methyltransferase [Verrucomicrobia bacterium]|nr:class I SAM-dependent methyltransferase [Verrucomicrobiota bacterium]MCH8511349.1 class I SAM-dependent methyltransferase [Kiritimatiellia bacterium]